MHYLGPVFLLLIMITGCCELWYEPAFTGDAPGSPGTEWEGKNIVYYGPSTILPYSPEDLFAEMSVSQLLDIALFNNPTTRASWNAARAAAFGYRASLSAYYPNLDFSSVLTAQHVSTDAGSASSTINTTANSSQGTITIPTTTTGSNESIDINTVFNKLTTSYLVLDCGGRDAQVDLALQTLYALNWQHNLAMQQVMINVLNAYTSYIGNKGLAEAALQDLQDAEVAFKAALKMKEAGLATLNDVLQSQAVLEQTRYNLEQAKGAEKSALMQLLIILGLPPETPITVQDLPQKLPVVPVCGNVIELIELAKKWRPDIGAAIAAVKQQQALLTISYSAGMPTLTANGVWSRLHFIHQSKDDVHNRALSLTLDFPLFEGFYYVNQQKQIRAQIEQALANVDVQVSLISANVVANYYAFTTAEASLPSSEAMLQYSERAYKGYLSQFKVGTASILDVLNALTVLSNARAQRILTRTQWAASLANLAFSVGILDDSSPFWLKHPPKELYELPYKDNKQAKHE